MKVTLIAVMTCLLLALAPDAAFAAKKKSTAAAKCTTGQICAANCNNLGWCSRMVCVGGKWEKRMVGCVGGFCGPKCS